MRCEAEFGRTKERGVEVCAFAITGSASPDLPLRVLNLFAQQSIVLDRVEIVRDGDLHRISLAGAMAIDRAAIILEKIRNLIPVCEAELACAAQ